MTAQELLNIARTARPAVRYTTNAEQTCIGAWSENAGRYVPVACQSLTGEWVSLPGEILIDGKPKPENWIQQP